MSERRLQQRPLRELPSSVGPLIVFWLTVMLVVFVLLLGYLDRSRQAIAFGALQTVMPIAYSAIGAMIVRRAHNRIGWLLQAIALVGLVECAGENYLLRSVIAPGSLPAVRSVALTMTLAVIPGLACVLLLFLLFPTGRPPSERWTWVGWAIVGAAVVTFIGALIRPGPMDVSDVLGLTNPLGIPSLADVAKMIQNVGGSAMFAGAIASVASLIVRFRRSSGEERQQIRWLAYIGALGSACFLIAGIGEAIGSVLIGNIGWIGFLGTILFGIPVATTVAIFKYRLYDLDVVINKTVVFGALAIFITVVYVGIVVGVGTLVGQGDKPNVALSILATAIVAVAFQPARERVQRFANRLVYGKRATPYEVLSGFSKRAAGTYATEDVLQRAARVVAEGTGAERVDVWLRAGGRLHPAGTWPLDASTGPSLALQDGGLPAFQEADRAIAVRHRDELIGAITLGKSRGEQITPAEDRLLDDLASQAGLVLHNAQLTGDLRTRLDELSATSAELQRSRQRIVAAHDAERRRLERNIHDGAQQHLVALAVRLRLAKSLAARDPRRAKRMLSELQDETMDALGTLQDLARGIYPPVLEEEGIAAALEAQARIGDVPVRVDPDGVGRQPIETEAAIYFCCLEAIQNAAKYARARSVTVRLGREGDDLTFTVVDDGVGFDAANTPPGSGLRNMLDRASALGGDIEVESEPGRGTTVAGRIPIPEPVR